MNIWDWHAKWQFEVFENGQKIENPQLRNVRATDPLYDEMREATGNGIKKFAFLKTATTYHMFEYKPQNRDAEIEIVATNEFGKEYFRFTTRME